MSLRLGLVSLHTDPEHTPGSGDAGGLNVHVLALADQLSDLGDEVEIITRRTSMHTDGVSVRASGVVVRRLPAGAIDLQKSALFGVLPEFTAGLLRLPRYNVLHSHYWLSAAAAIPVASETRARHVLSLHTLGTLKNRTLAPGDRPEPPERIRSEAESVRKSDALIAASPAERDAIVVDYAANPARVHTVSPGVDLALFRPRNSSEKPPAVMQRAHGRPVVSVLARIQPLKGQELAVRSVACLPDEIRPLLVLAGGTSPGHNAYADRLQALAEEHGVDLEMPGALTRAEAALLLAASDLVLVPSYSETFGLVALEAAASGVPVLGAAGSGLESSIADGRSGKLLRGRDPREWAAAMRSLLTSPTDRDRLAVSARAFAAEHSWRRTAELTRAVYLREQP